MQDRNRNSCISKRRRYLSSYQKSFDAHVQVRLKKLEASDTDSDWSDGDEDCPICRFPQLRGAYSLPCGHKGCHICLEYYFVQLEEGEQQCPVCKQPASTMTRPDGKVVTIPLPAPPCPRAPTNHKLPAKTRIDTTTVAPPTVKVRPNTRTHTPIRTSTLPPHTTPTRLKLMRTSSSTLRRRTQSWY